MDTLSRQQRRCLALAAEGDTNEQIAARLGLARETVHQHLVHVYQRLALEDIGNPRCLAAVMWARREGRDSDA